MDIELATGDITADVASTVDAIVNAANSSLMGGGGVDGAIHRAGGPDIVRACKQIRATSHPQGLPEGNAVATLAGRLPCRWVIHTVGPCFNPHDDRAPILRSCYLSSLRVAAGLGAHSVAFPLISAGVYGWPKDDAVRQALDALNSPEADATGVERAVLVLFDHDCYRHAHRVMVGSS